METISRAHGDDAPHEHNELERRRSKLVVLVQRGASITAAGEQEQAQLEQRGLRWETTAAAAASWGCSCADMQPEVTTFSTLLIEEKRSIPA